MDDDIRAPPPADSALLLPPPPPLQSSPSLGPASMPPASPAPAKAKRRLHAVVVPFLLTVGERDHRCLIETWLHALPEEARSVCC
jgi:hypothetical protein